MTNKKDLKDYELDIIKYIINSLTSEDRDIIVSILSEDRISLSKYLYIKEYIKKETIFLLSLYLHPELPERKDPILDTVYFKANQIRIDNLLGGLALQATSSNRNVIEIISQGYSTNKETIVKILENKEQKWIFSEIRKMAKRMAFVHASLQS